MSRISTILTFLATALVVSPTPAGHAETDAEIIARGRYIATAIQGCGCHTRERPDGSKDEAWHYAGSPNPAPPAGPPANPGWSTPRWKKISARNITPDAETGIGRWSEEQFVQTLKSGVRPDGTKFAISPMEWNIYANMKEEDARAIYRYLRTIKAISNRAPANIPPQ